MSDHNKDDASSFYYPSPEEIARYTAERETPTAEEVFLRQISHLNETGPFLGEEGRIALRAFSYKEVTLFGFLIEETHEAFMVLLPASLSRDEAGVKATQIIASPLARLMKTSVGIMSLPTPVQTLYYLSLSLKQFVTCPGYFTTARTQQVTNLIEMLKMALDVSETGTTLTSSKAKQENAIPRDTFQVPDSLIPRITH